MEPGHRIGSLLGRLGFQSGIRRLSKLASRLPAHPALSPGLQGLLGLAAAIAVGTWADHQNQLRADERWHEGHRPSRAVWVSSLARFGFQPLSGIEALHRIVRTLPTNVDPQAGAWIDRASGHVTVFDSETSEPWVLERRGTSVKPGDWEPLGRGWDGLEAALARLEGLKPESPKAQGLRPIAVDSRALQY
jgi:hypothetical protein